jgi:hypothetical protein
MKQGITRQTVLEAIIDLKRDNNGISPTHAEVATKAFYSVSNVKHHLYVLQSKGALEFDGRRNIRIPGERYLSPSEAREYDAMKQRLADLEAQNAEQARDIETLQREFDRETMFFKAKRRNSAHLLDQCRCKLTAARKERDNLRLQCAMLRLGITYPSQEFRFNPAAIILGGANQRPVISA